MTLYSANNYTFESVPDQKKIDVYDEGEYISTIYPLTHHYEEKQNGELDEFLISRCEHWLRYKKAA